MIKLLDDERDEYESMMRSFTSQVNIIDLDALSDSDGTISMKHGRTENGMNDDDDEIAEVFNSRGNAEVFEDALDDWDDYIQSIIDCMDDGDTYRPLSTHSLFKEGNDMFRTHGEVQFLDTNVLVRQTTANVIDALNDSFVGTRMGMSDIYDQYDYAEEKGMQIHYIYTMLDSNGTFSVFSGVEYYGGRIAIVGLNQDGWVDSYDSMVRKLIAGL